MLEILQIEIQSDQNRRVISDGADIPLFIVKCGDKETQCLATADVLRIVGALLDGRFGK